MPVVSEGTLADARDAVHHALVVLEAMEWMVAKESNQHTGGSPYGIWLPACAVCHGVKPNHRDAHIFKKKQRGHRKDCRLRVAIDKLSNINLRGK